MPCLFSNTMFVHISILFRTSKVRLMLKNSFICEGLLQKKPTFPHQLLLACFSKVLFTSSDYRKKFFCSCKSSPERQKFVLYLKYIRPIFGQIEFTPKRSVRKSVDLTLTLVSLSENWSIRILVGKKLFCSYW